MTKEQDEKPTTTKTTTTTTTTKIATTKTTKTTKTTTTTTTNEKWRIGLIMLIKIIIVEGFIKSLTDFSVPQQNDLEVE